MVTTEKNIKLTRGDSYGFNFLIEDTEDQAVELDACFFSVKENPDDDDYIFQKDLSRGIQRLSDGQYYVKVNPADTENLQQRCYYYDLECTIGENVFTFLKGKLDIKWDVTKE